MRLKRLMQRILFFVIRLISGFREIRSTLCLDACVTRSLDWKACQTRPVPDYSHCGVR